MNFYQAMQLDVSVCKGKIRNAANPSERHKLIAALIVKDTMPSPSAADIVTAFDR